MARLELIAAVVVVLSALFWIDPLFFPLVLLGPPVTRVPAAGRRMPLRWIVVVWLVAGLGAVASDFVVSQEDVLSHLVMTAFVVALAAGAWAVTRKLRP